MPDEQTLAQRVKAKYPGAYDDMDDAALEKSVLAKHPEYADMPKTSAQPPSSTIGPDNRGLLQRANDWWTRKPDYEGTLDRPGRSPREKASDAGTDIAVGSTAFLPGALAAAPLATVTALGAGYLGSQAGGYLGKKAGDAFNAPELGEDIGSVSGGAIGGVAGGKAGKAIGNKVGPALATALRTNTGALKPSVSGVARLVGAGAGYATGLHGFGELGGFVAGPAIADAFIPKGELGSMTNPGPFSKVPTRLPAAVRGDPFSPKPEMVKQTPFAIDPYSPNQELTGQDLISRTRKITIPGDVPDASDLKRAGDLTQAPLQKLQTLAKFGDKLAQNELNRRLKN